MRQKSKLILGSLMTIIATTACASGPVYPKIKFTYTAEDVKTLCAQTEAKAKAKIEKLEAMDHSKRTFQNTIVALERVGNEVGEAIDPVLFLKETSPSTAVQDAAAACQDVVSSFYVKVYSSAKLGAAVKAVVEQNLRLDLEDEKLLDEMYKGFQKSGALLPEAARVQVASMREELEKLENDFATNLAKANDAVEVSKAELEGLPQDYIDGLTRGPNQGYLITLLDASSYMPFVENAKNAEARKRVVTAHEKVAAAINTPLLEKAISLRHRIATALGYKNHAEYVLSDKMAGSPERVLEFLNDLRGKLRVKADSDLAALLELKKKDEPGATAIQMWDFRYYMNQLKKEKYSVDDELVRQYFPVDHVIEEVSKLYQTLLGVTFTEITPAYAWSPEVRLFEVRDASKGYLIGHYFFDLYPRANKYKHFAAFDIIHARTNKDGTYHTPVSSVVGNWPKPVGDKPALLSHDDVETFFHEFGHIMHQVLTTARYTAQAGTNVRGDYVEAPSQMLENWAWEKSILKKISKHYKTGEPLPDELIDKMIASKHANEGIYWSRQLFFATVDMTYHSAGESVDTTKLWHELQPEIMRIAPTEGAQPQASFGHLMGGYDAGYYGYLWSKVFAQDMYTVFEKQGLESPVAGRSYRKWILEPGGTQEPDALIRGFLGREPNKEAFYKSLGL